MRSLYNGKTSLTTPCNCDDPIECLRHMFCDMVQKRRVAGGQCPARSEYRQEKNSHPTTEPSVAGEPALPKVKCPFSGQTQPDENTYSLSKEDIERITHVRIHPGIGVARVGDSSSYYIGPEVINPKPTDFGATRDGSGAIKKQA